MRDIEYEATTPVGVHIVPDGDFSLVLHDGGHRVQMWCNDGVVDEWPVTRLRESTGLDDKNGKRIFEGDILAAGEYVPPREVIFEDAAFRVRDNDNHANVALVPATASRLSVVGNIYDNSELIEG